MNDISSRIKYALKYRNVKAKELSEMTGISRSSISEWLSGKYEPKQDKIFIIANALNVDEAWLLGLDVPIERKSTITSIYNELEPPRQEVVYKFAERQLQEQNEKPKVVQFPIIEDDKEIEILSGHESAAGFAILGDDSNMTSTVMKASKVPNGADEVVVIKGNSMEPLIMDGEQVFIRHQPSVENGEIAIVAILDDGITCKKVYYDDAEGTVTLESVNDDYEDMVFPVEDIRIIGKVLGK